MRAYEVTITPDARDDLAAIRDHIAYRLGSPSPARLALRSIRKGLGTLAIMPGRARLIEQEPWRSRGVRRLLVGNFYAYYRIAYLASNLALDEDQMIRAGGDAFSRVRR